MFVESRIRPKKNREFGGFVTVLCLLVFSGSMVFANESKELSLFPEGHAISQCAVYLMNQKESVTRIDSKVTLALRAAGKGLSLMSVEESKNILHKVVRNEMIESGVPEAVANVAVGEAIFKEFQSFFEAFVRAQLYANGIRTKKKERLFLKAYLYSPSEEVKNNFIDSVILRIALTLNPNLNISQNKALEQYENLLDATFLTAQSYGRFLDLWSAIIGEGQFDLLQAYLGLHIRNYALSITKLAPGKPASKGLDSLFFRKSSIDQELKVAKVLTLSDDCLSCEQPYDFDSLVYPPFHNNGSGSSSAFQKYEKLKLLAPVIQFYFLEKYFAYFNYEEIKTLVRVGRGYFAFY